MTKATDFISALNQRRLLKTGKSPDERIGLPTGWQAWLDAMHPVKGRVARPDSRAWVDALNVRPLQQPKGLAGLARPFFKLLRQSRPFDPRDERGLRIGATAADILLHLILAGLLLWLMYLQLFAMEVPEEENGSSDAVQVEFIGRGNVQEGGGAIATEGAQAAPAAASAAASGKPTPQPAAAASASAASSKPTVETVPMPAAVAAASQAPKLEQVAPLQEPAPAQPLQVSATPKPTAETFRLPPPRELSLPTPQPQPREPQLQAQVEAITTFQAQPVRTLQVQQPQAQLRPQELREAVREIEVFTPDRSQITRERALPSSATGQAQIRVPTLQGEVRGIPSGSGSGGSSTASAGNGSAALGNAAERGAGGNATSPGGQGQAQSGTGHGVAPGTAGGRGASATGAGAGPGARPAPGGWPGAARSDDWGASNRNAPGTGRGGNGDGGNGNNGRGNNGNGNGQSGLFNNDGSVRLPDQWSANHSVDLDRAGTWLKRPGLEYRGTRFDKYWLPSGTLLQEWVRKGVKELSIPIPGTSMSLKCVVSLLQLGGGCIPFNPDVNEQSATGRPAPVIPFKPELQEDNGSVRPPPVAPKPATPAAPKPATPAAPKPATPAPPPATTPPASGAMPTSAPSAAASTPAAAAPAAGG